jgi:hypothetical protein
VSVAGRLLLRIYRAAEMMTTTRTRWTSLVKSICSIILKVKSVGLSQGMMLVIVGVEGACCTCYLRHAEYKH